MHIIEFYYLYWSYTSRSLCLKDLERPVWNMGFKAFFFFLYCNGCRITGFFAPKFQGQVFSKLVLVFLLGPILFSITVLPPFTRVIFQVDSWWKNRFYSFLIGFYSKQILEFLSSGIEHGHTHHLQGWKQKRVITVMLGFIYSCVSWKALTFSRQFDRSRISCRCSRQ